MGRRLRTLLLLAAAAGACAVAQAQPAATGETGPASPTPVAAAGEGGAVVPARLIVFNRVVATMRARVLGLAPEERVAAASARIRDQVARSVFGPVTVEPASGAAYGIDLAGSWMFDVTAADAQVAGDPALKDAAVQAAHRLATALAAAQEQRDLPKLGRAIGFTLGALVLLVLAVRVNHRLARLTRVWLRRLATRRRVRLTLWGFLLVDRVRLQRAARWSSAAASRLLDLVLAYLWVVFALRQFPYTRPWSQQAHAFILGNVSKLALTAVGTVPGLVVVALIVVFTRWLAGVMSAFFALVESRRLELPWLHPDLVQPTRRIARIALWLLAVVVAYPFIPFSDSTVFKGVSVLLGVMLSLGSSGVVGQAMSGLVLMYARALRAGEFVRVGDTEGTVISLGMLSTKIRTTKGEEVTIPNSVMVATPTKNYSRLADAGPLLLYTSVTIGYDTPWRQVHALLVGAAERTPGLASWPAPFVLQTALSDFYVEYQINARLQRPEARPQVLSELHANIQDLFNEHGVQIMSPHYRGDPSEPKVVARERWFAPPAQPGPDGS